MRPVRIALRRLRRQPGFTAAAIGALALGVAAPTALFAIVNATLLRPLPFSEPQDIYALRTTMTDGRFTIGLVASAEMNALRQATDLVVQSALAWQNAGTIEVNGTARAVTAYGVNHGFFGLFGLPMAQGRAFNDSDDKSWMGGRVVLSYHAWHDWFGGDPHIVGRTVRIEGGPALVIGVAPPEMAIPRDADLWFSMPPDNGIGHQFLAWVRLKPGVTPAAVQARLGGMWADLGTQYPDMEQRRAFVMTPLLETVVGTLGPVVMIAFAATGLLLLLAVVNVTNLLLAQGAARTREMAVRAALGATRADVFQTLVSEALILAAAALAIALPLAYLTIRAVVFIGGAAWPRVEGLHVDWHAFVFAAAVMLLAAFAVSLAPFAATARQRLAEIMNEGGRGQLLGRGTRRTLAVMVVAEVTLAIVLVTGAGRLLLSVQHLVDIDPGFTAAGRLAVDVELPVRPYLQAPARMAAWLDDADGRLRALGATEVALATTLPLRHEWDSTVFTDITGRPTLPANRPNARLRAVSPGFFHTMGIRLVAGRAFTADDRRGGAPVVIVNQTWARKFLPGLDPLHERVDPGVFATQVDGKFVHADAAIVGVVQDVPYVDLATPAEPTVYVSSAQVPQRRFTFVVTAANGRPEDLIPQIRAGLAALDPNVPVAFETMSHVVAASLIWPKLGLLLMATFGGAGLVLAATGVFGVMAFVAAQRTGEMAVRMALGATRGEIFRMVLRQAGALAAGGLALGLVLAWWSGRLMARYVYHVSPANLLVLAGSAGVVLVVALVAGLPSARKAGKTDPARVLKT